MVDRTNASPRGTRGAETDDADLVEAVAAGDRRALATLYDRHSGLLYSVARQLLRERAEVEDLVHDVFLEVWKQAHTYEPGRASVRRWLLVRLRSRALDRLRSHAFSRRRSLDSDERVAPDDPSQTLDERRVEGFLAELTEDQRQVVTLSYFDGLSSSEIASELGIPLGTVKSRMAAALQRLRGLVEAVS
ncbi:MAG: sigma-70 family RNA polymerase sigma factor [Sandaracinus sp.]|nr:sigma-70 family RNA polymerase sigma factor [Sandaracinus sp.]